MLSLGLNKGRVIGAVGGAAGLANSIPAAEGEWLLACHADGLEIREILT